MNLLRMGVWGCLLGGWMATQAHAAVSLRWTGFDDPDASSVHILRKIEAQSGLHFTTGDFILVESRNLTRESFQMYAQTVSGVPVNSMSIRIWKDLLTGRAVQVEAKLQDPASFTAFTGHASFQAALKNPDQVLSSQETRALVEARIEGTDDARIRDLSWKQEWDGGDLVRVVKVKARRGTHTVRISMTTKKVVRYRYDEFPQADTFTMPAKVYPIYEEANGKILPRVNVELKNLKRQVARVTTDPYTSLRLQHYYESKMDPSLGMTEAGRADGFWSPTYVRALAESVRAALPASDNTYANGVILEGQYATVSLSPSAMKLLPKLTFTPAMSSHFKPDWSRGLGGYEMTFGNSFLGRPITSESDGVTRVAYRAPDNDPATYLNDGFDEIQVYYAVNQLFDSLRPMGFTDPELSTRPFNAFLYDTDIEWKNNAFYTDDTINFTTYTPEVPNMARDNSTIWHELGHGVMDRLMGDALQLADTGGLSEGMADFVAQLVVTDVTHNEPFEGSDDFRIMNHTHFNLTNEVHDDGEAYGGSMYDLLQAAIARDGSDGLRKVTDLTLETMRLSRNHPGLTAQDWFTHMLFADQLGAPGVRAPGELKELIQTALGSRNFSFDGKGLANFSLKNGDQEVVAGAAGSRSSPIPVELGETDKATYTVNVALKSGDSYHFTYPVEVRVYFNRGALQGAIRWDGEDAEPKVVTLASEADTASIPLTVSGQCDFANREDGSCVDYAYVQIWNAGETKAPSAKKRFYLRVKKPAVTPAPPAKH